MAATREKRIRLSVTESELDILAEALDSYMELIGHEPGAEDTREERKLLRRIKKLLGEDDDDDEEDDKGDKDDNYAMGDR